jgi:hypothetical protein
MCWSVCGRDAAVNQQAAVSAALSDQRVAGAELQSQLEATQHQVGSNKGEWANISKKISLKK